MPCRPGILLSMALVTTAAAVAGTTALAHYLDGRFHLLKDLKVLHKQRLGVKLFQKVAKEDRISLWYQFSGRVNEWPNATCLWSRDGIYTWQETFDAACRYAQHLISVGVQRGQLVAVYLTNRPEFMIIWLALFSIGCAPAMINYNLTGDALVHCLQVSGAHTMIADDDEACQQRINETRDRIQGQLKMQIIILDEAKRREVSSLPAKEPEKSYRHGTKGSDPMGLFYTSGTTGFPKGCSYTLKRTWLYIPARANRMDQKPGPNGDRWYICMPSYHATGGAGALGCLLSGVSMAIGRRFSVSNFWKDIHDSDSTLFIYVGETARYLLAAPPGPYDTTHRVRGMYGNGLRPEVWTRFQERFNVPEVGEFFSSSEGLFNVVNWVRDPHGYLVGSVGHHGVISRNRYHNTYVPVAVNHETGDMYRDPKTGFAKRNSYNEGGEILVKLKSEADFQGYWNAPEATEKKYVRNVFQKGDLYYRTGDALRRLDDGRWFFMDRLGDTFRWKSENVSTAEVSEVLGRYPGVVEANVYGVLVPNHDGRAGCAAILIEEGHSSSFNFNGLLAHARKHLPRYAVPIFIRVIESSVISHNNKQNKTPLREEGVDPDMLGKKVTGSGERDRLLWVRQGGEGYVDFGRNEWEALQKGHARL
ncbi:AMP dependent ligase [Exophiala viscosa]|uniref:Very long-chain fatty acid transport protein n=1 Tax=Exophiala viscosa TaxID=2486360 RepID=A0AAN6DSL4_9EURO|nr:AMP dependent ligase [Exophiala viscosa]KAI1623820.1 AMP dependent ligase [Exophiala viscosa]